jgi:hypothetical protein
MDIWDTQSGADHISGHQLHLINSKQHHLQEHGHGIDSIVLGIIVETWKNN